MRMQRTMVVLYTHQTTLMVKRQKQPLMILVMTMTLWELTQTYVANSSLICNKYTPGSPVNNTDITKQKDNDVNDNTETADHNNDEDAYEISENSIHDEKLT
eukprot:3438187-Ditylum_brightwellii.AAC.1